MREEKKGTTARNLIIDSSPFIFSFLSSLNGARGEKNAEIGRKEGM
jgi:uncharacterized membrane-anchored protein